MSLWEFYAAMKPLGSIQSDKKKMQPFPLSNDALNTKFDHNLPTYIRDILLENVKDDKNDTQ